jgi:hypothetical protein
VDGRRNVSGPISVPQEEYAANLEMLVERLKKSGATLIWASTTFVQGGWGRRPGDDVAYNRIAADIMNRHDVRINDLHALTAAFPRFGEAEDGIEMFRRAGNVHFTDAGSHRIAQQAAAEIRRALVPSK